MRKAALALLWGTPEAHAQTAPKTLSMLPDPASASGKSGALTNVVVSNPGQDFQVMLRAGTTGTCIVHTSTLADALALRETINNATTTRIACIDSAQRYVIPPQATSTTFLQIYGP